MHGPVHPLTNGEVSLRLEVHRTILSDPQAVSRKEGPMCCNRGTYKNTQHTCICTESTAS